MKRYGLLAGCIILACGVMWPNLTSADFQGFSPPDLIPSLVQPGGCKGQYDYCNLVDLGSQLVVVVKNRGKVSAPSSSTAVRYHNPDAFLNFSFIILETPPIPPGGFVVLITPPKSPKFWYGRAFRIIVDFKKEVIEGLLSTGKGEENNSVEAECHACEPD